MPATPQYLGCKTGISTGAADIVLDLNTALDTTGGGAGHSGGFAGDEVVILVTYGQSITNAGLFNSDSNDGGGIASWYVLDDGSGTLTTTQNKGRLYARRLNIGNDSFTGPTLTILGGTATHGTAAIAWVFKGIRPDTPAFTNPSYIGKISNQTGIDPQPPTLPLGTTADNDLILTAYLHNIIDATVTTPPNYTLTATAPANSSATPRGQIGGAIRQLAVPSGSSETPGTFSGYTTGNWCAFTIPLDPAIQNLTDSVTETAATSTTQTATAFTNIGESAAAADVVSATKSNPDGRVFGGVYTVDFALSGWSGRTLRQCFNPSILAVVPPGPMGARLEFAAGTSTTIGPAYIGHAAGAGDAYDFDGAQVQLTFDGGSATKAVAGAVSIDTDKVSFPGYDPTKNLIVSCYLGAGTVNPKGYGF